MCMKQANNIDTTSTDEPYSSEIRFSSVFVCLATIDPFSRFLYTCQIGNDNNIP